jgi:hypothetical protein
MRRISSSWKTTLDKLGFRRRRPIKSQVRRNRSIEMLEARHMMSADPIIVDTLEDVNDTIYTEGQLSLRDALDIARNQSGDDVLSNRQQPFYHLRSVLWSWC